MVSVIGNCRRCPAANEQRAHFARVLVQLACGETLHGPGTSSCWTNRPQASTCVTRSIISGGTPPARLRAQNGTAVIAVLHDLNLAMRFADRIVLLHRGKLAMDGDRAEAMTADMIRRIFEIDVVIQHTADGVPFLLPQTMQPLAAPVATP